MICTELLALANGLFKTKKEIRRKSRKKKKEEGVPIEDIQLKLEAPGAQVERLACKIDESNFLVSRESILNRSAIRIVSQHFNPPDLSARRAIDGTSLTITPLSRVVVR